MANPNIPEFHKYEGNKTWIKNQVEKVFNDTSIQLNSLKSRIVEDEDVPNDKIIGILSDFKGNMEKNGFKSALGDGTGAGFTLALQIALKKLDEDPGPLDGIYRSDYQKTQGIESKTMKAVKSFQNKWNTKNKAKIGAKKLKALDEDGIAGPLTLERILEELEKLDSTKEKVKKTSDIVLPSTTSPRDNTNVVLPRIDKKTFSEIPNHDLSLIKQQFILPEGERTATETTDYVSNHPKDIIVLSATINSIPVKISFDKKTPSFSTNNVYPIVPTYENPILIEGQDGFELEIDDKNQITLKTNESVSTQTTLSDVKMNQKLQEKVEDAVTGAQEIIAEESKGGEQKEQETAKGNGKDKEVIETAEDIEKSLETELLGLVGARYDIIGIKDISAKYLDSSQTPTISGTIGDQIVTIKFDQESLDNPVLQVGEDLNLHLIAPKVEGEKAKIYIVPDTIAVLQKFKNYASSLQIGEEKLSNGKFDLSDKDKVTIVFEKGKEKIRVDFDNQAQLISGQTVNVGNKSYKVSIEGGGIVLTESEEAALNTNSNSSESIDDKVVDVNLDLFKRQGFTVNKKGNEVSVVLERILFTPNKNHVKQQFQNVYKAYSKGDMLIVNDISTLITEFDVSAYSHDGGKYRMVGELRLRPLSETETKLFKAVKFTDYTKVTDVNEDKGKITAKYKGVSIEFSGDNLTMTHNKQDYPLYYKQGEEFDINNSATQIVNLQKISKYIGENLKDDFKYDLSGKNGEITLHHTDGTKINFKDGVLTDYVTNNKNIYLNTKDRLVIEENIKGEVSLLSLKDELAKLVFLTQDDKTGSFSAPTNFTEIVNKYTELTSNNGLLNKMSDNNQIKKEYNAVKDKMQEWIKIRDLYEKINANKDKLGSDFEIDPQEGAPITFLKKKGSRRAPLISTKEDGSLVFSKRILRDKQLNALSS